MMNKMRKMKNKKGFTLMEMLIVVAIIAILIAIAIPTFASSLNKARVATDEANIRSGYASVMVQILDPDNTPTGNAGTRNFALNKDGSVTELTATVQTAADAYECQGNASDTVSIGGVNVTAWKKGATVTYSYNTENGTVTISATNA